jgi:hypothetical protein
MASVNVTRFRSFKAQGCNKALSRQQQPRFHCNIKTWLGMFQGLSRIDGSSNPQKNFPRLSGHYRLSTPKHASQDQLWGISYSYATAEILHIPNLLNQESRRWLSPQTPGDVRIVTNLAIRGIDTDSLYLFSFRAFSSYPRRR